MPAAVEALDGALLGSTATAPLRDAVAARAAALLAELEPQAVGNIVWSLD